MPTTDANARQHPPLLLAAALALAACAPRAPAPAVRADDPAGAIADADRAMSAAAGARDEAAFRAFLDPATAWVGSRGAFAEGPDAVVRAWARFLSPGGPTIAWEPEVARVAASGDLGYSLGAASITSEGKVAWEGRYATVWRREASGRFLVVLDMSDADPAPLAALARETTRVYGSRAGDLEARAGPLLRDGAPAGAWMTVRVRDPDGTWRTAIDTAVPAR